MPFPKVASDVRPTLRVGLSSYSPYTNGVKTLALWQRRDASAVTWFVLRSLRALATGTVTPVRAIQPAAEG